MSETGRISDLLRRAHEGGDAWKCPSLRELLGSVTAAQAAARPVPGAPSIWEVLLHITASAAIARRRLTGERGEALPEELAWPRPTEMSPEAWRGAVDAFADASRGLRQAVAGFADSRLTEAVPGREYPFCVMLYGLVEHALYHAGQIEVLMAAQGLRPEGSPRPAFFR
jgi:uncharacterized damage-inducible protein DinB